MHAIEQAPRLHEAVPLTELHAAPHAPQLLTLVWRLVSQPFEPLPSQLPKPLLQVGEHTLLTHAVVPLGLTHALVHEPQCEIVLSGTSQPLVARPSQLPNPLSHAPSTQLPVAHDSDAFARSHAEPHEPQSDRVLSEVSQPSSGSPLQLANPETHTGEHTPEVHEVVPFGFVHALPHIPQFAVVFNAVSQPLSCALLSQLPQPEVHAIEQAPSEHEAVPLALLHTVPHAPQ